MATSAASPSPVPMATAAASPSPVSMATGGSAEAENGAAPEISTGTSGKAVSAEAENRALPATEISTKNTEQVTGGKAVSAEAENGALPAPEISTGNVAGSAFSAASTTSPFAIIWSKVTPARATFVLFSLLSLWFSADDPRRATWTFCVIASSYVSLWTVYFTVEIRVRTVLVSVSYVALVANAVANLSSKAGIFVMILDTGYAAGLFGYALAGYRQRRGLEQAAESALKTIRSRSEEELKHNKNVVAMVTFYSVVVSFACTLGALWMIYYVVDMYLFVFVLSLLIDFSLFFWTCLVGLHLLHGAIVEDESMGFVYWSAMLLLLVDFVLTYLFGSNIGMLVHPLGVMGIAGLLGYTLCVYAHYKTL